MSAALEAARAVPAGLAVAGPVVVPLLAAAICLLIRTRVAHWTISVGTLTLLIANAALLLVRVDADGPVAVQAGGWQAPVGITLVADRLSVLLVLTSTMMLLGVIVYAFGQLVTDANPAPEHNPVRLVFTPIYLVLTTGVCFAFLTGDLFNLFVAFEVMLIASYVLVTFGAGSEAVRTAMTYIVVSLLASSLFVATIGLVYATTGTVNLAGLHEALGGVHPGVRTALALSLIVVFGIKAALFPMHMWLPDSYPLTPAPVTAVFAGLLTKVGVYAIIRTQTLAFPEDTHITGPVLLTLAGATLFIGILGAIAQNEIKRVLSFTIVSHVGFMVMGLGLFTVIGVTAAVFYVAHHIITQTALFCVEGLIERRTGTSHLDRISGLATTAPGLTWLFALAAMSLAGIPPFSGFLGKAALVRAGIDASSWPIVLVAVGVSLLTVYAVARVWVGAFWGHPSDVVREVPGEDDDDIDVGIRHTPAAMRWATAGVVAVGLAVPVVGGPLFAYCGRAAADLLDPASYLLAVTGG